MGFQAWGAWVLTHARNSLWGGIVLASMCGSAHVANAQGVPDTTPPRIITMANLLTRTDPGKDVAYVQLIPPFVEDDVDGPLTWTTTSSPTPGLSSDKYFPLGETTITYSATDSSGNTATASFTVTVVDNEPPWIIVPGSGVINTDYRKNTAVINYPMPDFGDNVGVTSGPTLISGLPSGSAFPVGDTIVTYQVEDAAGNTATDSFTMTVVDNEPPFFLYTPDDIVVPTDPGKTTAKVVYPTPLARDSVDGQLLVDRIEGLSSGAEYPLGTTVVTYSTTDVAGNTTTTSFNVTVLHDTEAPIVSVDQTVQIYAETEPGKNTAVVTYPAPTASDNIGVVSGPTLVRGLPSGSVFPVGDTFILFEAKDAAGNTGTNGFVITVVDREAPVITVPANIAVETDPGKDTAVVTFTTSATDAVDGDITPVITTSPTAGLSSGDAFPTGVTTVRVRAADVEGNIGDKSFTITVAVPDDEAPVFNSTQGDITLEVPYGQSSAEVNFPTPTATDNSGNVTVTQVSGPVSGSAFPVGSTIVTFEARDDKDNTARLSFTVIVKQADPATVRFIVLSKADGVVTFNSPTKELSAPIRVSGGRGQSTTANLRPGRYYTSFTPPTGLAVTQGHCSNDKALVNTQNRRIDMTLTSGQNVTCTLTMIDSAGDSARQIQSFIENRARQIMAHQPNADRRLARVRGQTRPQSVSVMGAPAVVRDTPVAVTVTRRKVQLSFSSSDVRGTELSGPSKWDFWAEAAFSRYETSLAEGRFTVLHLGADYRITPDSILGLTAQLDHNSEIMTGSPAETEGTGWMVGPYYTAKLAQNIYLDLSAKWGRASNTLNPLGTFSDEFNSTRWYASAALFGEWQQGATSIRPTLRLNYFRETTDPFINSLGVAIAGQETSLGDLTAGALFRWSQESGSGWTMSPYVKVDGIWTFEASGTPGRFSTLNEGLRAKAEVGMALAGKGGENLDFSVTYDGIGDHDYEAISARLNLSVEF